MVNTLPPNAESVASIRVGEDKNAHALRCSPPSKKKANKRENGFSQDFKNGPEKKLQKYDL